MLQLNYIRENRNQVVERLAVKNFRQIELVDQIIALDEQRRQIQNQSDSIAAEANSSAKKIGDLMRQGKSEEAQQIKSRSTAYKEEIRALGDALEGIEKELQEKLVQLPNLPASAVPKGDGPEDNEVVLQQGRYRRSGTMPCRIGSWLLNTILLIWNLERK